MIHKVNFCGGFQVHSIQEWNHKKRPTREAPFQTLKQGETSDKIYVELKVKFSKVQVISRSFEVKPPRKVSKLESSQDDVPS